MAASIFFRLPKTFWITFLLLFVFWTLYLFKMLHENLKWIMSQINFPDLADIFLLNQIDDVVRAAVIVFIYGVGLCVVYNIAVLTNWIWFLYGMKPARHVPVRHPPPQDAPRDHDVFKDVQKIGIVLAGGGAKGAFQAGAMKAIYQYLSERNALNKVKVIAGTSIGSWNALFWIADLVKSERGWNSHSTHENWWRKISLKRLIAPCWFVPGFRNAFFVTAPWQRSFDEVFGQDEIKRRVIDSKLHFYFTRSNVKTGRLECTTNNTDAPNLPRVYFKRLRRATSKENGEKFLSDIKEAVFASMDLPPLFPYIEMAKDRSEYRDTENEGSEDGHVDKDLFEDGGVVDNLPIMFAGLEGCDLIFVLPLTSDFSAEPNHRSLISRFVRVMDVRQGAIERFNLKSLYLYNELAVLRNQLNAINGNPTLEIPPAHHSNTYSRAMKRAHVHSTIFAVCPLRSLVERTIDTVELWKSKQAGVAFDIMYQHTLQLLVSEFDPKSETIKIALISRDERPKWYEDF